MNEKRSTHPKISLRIPFVIIVFLFQPKLFAVNAPYLISAQAIDDNRISLSWRNNDISAEKIVILRKTASAKWSAIDSLPATILTHVDDLLSPSTEYYYALLAIASGQISDTSNTLSAKTLEKIKIFFIPKINVVRIESNKTIDVGFLDSCNLEKKFRLHRKKIDGAWAVIDSQNNCSPDSMVWRVFHDKTPAANTWYSYKVEAYNATITAFSPETTVYNYVQPDNNQKYTISLLSSIPANPVSWIERIGDSLFFPEKLPQGDTQIAIIDISKPQSPQFKSYFKQNAIPNKFKNSIVDARINLHPENLFFKSLKGYYFIAIAGTKDCQLNQYDSLSQSVIDSFQFNNGWKRLKCWFVSTLNDTCFLLGYSIGGNSGTVNSCIIPVVFNSTSVEKKSSPMVWNSPNLGGFSTYGESLGCFDKKVVYNTFYEIPGVSFKYTFNLCDFSIDFSRPLLFTFTDTIPKYVLGNVNTVFDNKITINCKITLQGLSIQLFDISDCYSSPSRNVGTLLDSTFKSTSIVNTAIDTLKKQFIVLGNSGISIYSYSKGGVPIKHDDLNNYSISNKIKVIQSFQGIYFNHSLHQQVYLEIFDVKGRIIRQIMSLPHKPLFWDKKDINNRLVAPGFYIFKITSKENIQYSGSLLITQ